MPKQREKQADHWTPTARRRSLIPLKIRKWFTVLALKHSCSSTRQITASPQATFFLCLPCSSNCYLWHSSTFTNTGKVILETLFSTWLFTCTWFLEGKYLCSSTCKQVEQNKEKKKKKDTTCISSRQNANKVNFA